MRIALVAGPDPGHIFPITALALALRDRGHEVAVATGERWETALSTVGIQRIALPIKPAPEGEGFGDRLWKRSAELAPFTAEVLKDWGTEGIVADTLTVNGQFAAGVLRLPWLELIPHPLQDISRVLPPPGSGLVPGKTPFGKGRDALLRNLTLKAVAMGRRQRDAAAAELGIPAEFTRARRRLIATLPALEPERPDWPADCVLVGPMEWDPARGELAPPPGDGPLILVSSTTASGWAGRNAKDLLSVTIAGVSRLGVRVACTRFDAHPGPLPPWVVAGPGQQAPLFAAASLLVAGAGHGIIAKALVRGMPIVTVPGAGEQRENASRLAQRGTAVVVRPERLSPRTIERAVVKALTDPAYRIAAETAARTAEGLGPAFAAEVAERELAAAPVPV
jgi:UDP:flavonoid glycosyltransferase YjiC (YdhE family)